MTVYLVLNYNLNSAVYRLLEVKLLIWIYQKKIQKSEHCKRKEKKKDLYWKNYIFKNRAAKKARILCEMEEINSRCSDSNDLCESTVTTDYKCMSLNELKNLIKKTRY